VDRFKAFCLPAFPDAILDSCFNQCVDLSGLVPESPLLARWHLRRILEHPVVDAGNPLLGISGDLLIELRAMCLAQYFWTDAAMTVPPKVESPLFPG
jgi:hypothetical protein